MLSMFKSNARPGLDVKTAIEKCECGDVVVIDVREVGEVAASGKAKGALHIPLATLRMKADPRSPECLAELKNGKPIAVYCASGGRSGMAVQVLQQMGHDDVHNIGGFGHWVQAGGSVG